MGSGAGKVDDGGGDGEKGDPDGRKELGFGVRVGWGGVFGRWVKGEELRVTVEEREQEVEMEVEVARVRRVRDEKARRRREAMRVRASGGKIREEN